jgi:autotransporter-associated beta strand protein
MIISAAGPAHTQDATWLLNPGSGAFNAATNWNPATVPTNTATFGASNATSILFQPFITTSIGTMQFNPGAPAYVFATSPTLSTQIRITGTGIVDNSSNAPTFIVGNQANLFFSNASTAGDATIITNGVTAFIDSSTGGSARLIANAGGNLDISGLSTGGMTAGSIEGAGIFNLGVKQLTVGSNNLSTTVSGTINGAGGSLVKIGNGTLTLTGINTYTGPTTVDAGALIVNGSIASSSSTAVTFGGLLSGTGTVGNLTIGPGGTFAPGNGTPGSSMTVAGNLLLAPASIYSVQVNSQSASFANVTGNAFLAGTLAVNVSQTFFVPRIYTILSASGFVFGRFDSAFDNRPSFEAELSYTPHSVFLSLEFDPRRALSPPGGGGSGGGTLNQNQSSVVNALINSFNATGQIPVAFGSIATPNDLSQLSGEVSSAVQQTAFNTMDRFVNVLLDPFLGERGGRAPIDRLAAYAPEDGRTAMTRKAPPFAGGETIPRWSLWATGYGGTQSTSGDPIIGSHDTRSNIGGLAAGADYRLSPDTLVGFGFGGAFTNFTVANGLGSGSDSSFQAGAYVRHSINNAYVAAALAYGLHDVITDRTVTFAGFDPLNARFDVHTVSGRAEVGYRFATPWTGVTPYAAGQSTTIFLPAYNEQSPLGGTDPFALSYTAKDVTAPRSELGLRGDTSFVLADAVVTLRDRIAWAHNFNTSRAAVTAFQLLPVSSFVVNGAAPDADAALLSATAEMKWLNGYSVALRFDSELSGNVKTYAGTGIIRYQW